MNPHTIDTARDDDLRLSMPAMQRAARRALELARQSGTAIVVTRQGVIETIYPPPVGTGAVAAGEPGASYGDVT
ncbi:hypothetical protein [Leptothrix discophora]|uniref:Uncharacterized protein n=1 Tax=Leptothrix discophora TaxID=89 RepID=A0ABT9G0I8_LEPDI|nr:hypothetical protein [Leptothrix discophora]MDP4299986.1 hypothetical protein [Leptothrix discophora]